MDITPNALVGATVSMQQALTAQQVQVAVLRRTLDMQAISALTLLQAVPGSLPLATSGSLGTQVNQVI